MLANYEEFRQIIIQTNGNFARLMGPANVSIRVALLHFMTGKKYSKAKAGINELKKELRLYTNAPTNECEAVIDSYVYKQILNYNAKPKLEIGFDSKKIKNAKFCSTQESLPTPVEKQFTAKDLLTEANGGMPTTSPSFKNHIQELEDMKLMTEENKNKFSRRSIEDNINHIIGKERQPYERQRLSFEELIDRFSNGREKYQTNAFFNHCIRILLGGLSYIEMIEILFQHIDRQDEQITDLIKHSQIPVKLNQN